LIATKLADLEMTVDAGIIWMICVSTAVALV